MSSPLEGRIRVIAQEVMQQAGLGGVTGGEDAGLQQQIADLHEHLHVATTAAKRLEQRLEALEAAVRGEAPEEAPRRGRRKTVEQ